MGVISRALVIVLDSVGVGELPDAAEYGDAGSNTLGHLADAVEGLEMPNLAAMGLGNITPVRGVKPSTQPLACYGKMAERSAGKDTTTGHWEMMGLVTERPFPTYPDGFPDDIIREFGRRVGRGVLGNKVASGTEIISELGDEHVRTGMPIVYTSADSVFQIACHEDVVPVEDLYEMCRAARAMLTAPHNVQRVIARPFVGCSGSYSRTERRRDFALEPHGLTLLDLIVQSGGEVVGIGKIEDVFAGRGVTRAIHTSSNSEGVDAVVSTLASGKGTMVFANLVDFDMLFGHRNDVQGYASALAEFDAALPRIVGALAESDIMVITADHGCDPTTPGTDHTREYVPLLVHGGRVASGIDLGTRGCFCDLACTVADALGIAHSLPGTSFASDL